ncbi:hypothetical protein [Aliivibrio fischeri]|uniref:hypothetical protein n=1 Tax=Aliivibrio fischeri TaxID=668 RepID=UPI0012D9EFCD|nr:hypothetical protein [Aliivibrio fischeri]MUJ20447.1 hypothetical protein [Aliivibrio fischeri]
MKIAKLISTTQSAISVNLDIVRSVEKTQFVDVLTDTNLFIKKNVEYVFLENAIFDPDIARLYIEKCIGIRTVRWVVIMSVIDELTDFPIYFDLNMKLEDRGNQVKLKIINKNKSMYLDIRKLLAVLDCLKSKRGLKALFEWINFIRLDLSVRIRFF